MKKLLTQILCLFLVSNYFLNAERAKALIPYYYFPSMKTLEKESLTIGKYAYQLLHFGQIEDGLNLAKLAVKLNKSNEKLWLILSEAQIANNLYDDALISLEKAQIINSKISELYFAKSSIFLKKSELKKAKLAIEEGLKIEPNNYKAIFQLGNIFLMEKDYSSSIKIFEKAIKIKPDFWQAINNQALAYFEQDQKKLSIKFFKEAISIEENAEPLLGLASSLSREDLNSAIKLARKALILDPNYVEYDYRKEQLWGEKLQKSTEKLFKNVKLQEDIMIAKSKISKNS